MLVSDSESCLDGCCSEGIADASHHQESAQREHSLENIGGIM